MCSRVRFRKEDDRLLGTTKCAVSSALIGNLVPVRRVWLSNDLIVFCGARSVGQGGSQASWRNELANLDKAGAHPRLVVFLLDLLVLTLTDLAGPRVNDWLETGEESPEKLDRLQRRNVSVQRRDTTRSRRTSLPISLRLLRSGWRPPCSHKTSWMNGSSFGDGSTIVPETCIVGLFFFQSVGVRTQWPGRVTERQRA